MAETSKEQILKGLSLIVKPGSVVELRILNTRQGTVSGYFDDMEKMASAATKWSGKAPGVYFTLNPVVPDLRARSANHVTPYAKYATSDSDITRRIWFEIDLDAVRPAGISSTEEEHQLALERAGMIRAVLTAEDWSAPIFADSGNGGHLLYPIDLPNDDDSRLLLQRCLEALDLNFSDERVKVDLTTYNAARIWKVYGTLVCKGDNLPDRPHRTASILKAPDELSLVPVDLLRRLADSSPSKAQVHSQSSSVRGFDLGKWIDKHRLQVADTGPWKDATKWVLKTCPFNPSHTNRSAFIVQFSNGALAAGCKHNSCAGKGWRELRELVEPGWKTPAGDNNWPDPVDLGNELPPVAAFNPELLPKSFRPAAQDIAERMQVPLDFPGVSLVLALAGTVNRRAEIQPKEKDSAWVVKPNLWGGLIAPPGFMKSPTIATSTKPLETIEKHYRKEFEQQTQEFENAKELWELQKSAYKEMVKTALKSKKPLPERGGPPPDEPNQVRLIVNDATFESLHKIMAANPAGLLLIRDELSGFWAQLDRAGREGERAFYLQAWNGDTGHTIDRIGRGSIYVPACCVSMLGGIQPNKLRSYLVDTLKGGPSDDGLIQRFQLLVWPDLPSEWKLVDRPPNYLALEQVEIVFRNLVVLSADNPLRLRFSRAAQELFNQWLAELEGKTRSVDIPPALAGHLSKFRKTMPALALLFELADRAEEGFDGFVASQQADSQNFVEIALQQARQAAAWCEYLESHARRIYACVITPQIQAAHTLANKIREKKVGSDGIFSLRDVYLKGWSGLDSPELARGAVEVLQDAAWIRPLNNDTGPQGGRPAMRFEINPKARK